MSLLKALKSIDALNKVNLVRLALVSVFLTVVDTVQSYYLQRVVNAFSEANLMPRIFYSYGPVGFIMYAPIEFFAIFGTLIVLWTWASYVVWYHKNVVVKKVVQAEPKSALTQTADGLA